MSLKDTWKNKTDGVDDVVANDINSVAQAVINIEDRISTFVVNVTINSDGTVTADKNGLEIAQAYNEGRNIIAVSGYEVYSLITIMPNSSYGEAWFSNFDYNDNTTLKVLWCMGDSWGVMNYTLATKTQIDNLNTQITNNSNRITSLETNMGNVETALDNIIAIQNSLMGVSE